MQITGKIKLKAETQTFGAKEFKKRELVVTTDEQYPQSVLIEFVQDKCDLLNNFKVGDKVTVSIYLRGRGWVNPQGETKYFNSIQGWRIEANTDAPGASNEPQAAPAASNTVDDDLPF